MAIEKRFIHFKKFSDFNSKKLSANEANTQYTVGVSGEIQEGSPDVLYQSYVWIKDTRQQWTHGALYDCGDTSEFITEEYVNNAVEAVNVKGEDGYVYSNGEKVDMRFTRSLIPIGTDIPANADLNTIPYLKIGKYYCNSSADAQTISNCPVSVAFSMEIFNPLNPNVDDEETAAYNYRLRIIKEFNTGVQYTQLCKTTGTPGVWTYNPWYVTPRTSFALNSSKNDGSAAKGTDTKGVYINSDGEFKEMTYTLGKDVPSSAEFTDTKVTSVNNHYTPTENTNSQIDAPEGEAVIGLKRDSAGHVVGVITSSLVTEEDISAMGFTKNTGTITGVSANGTSIATSGVANIPAATTSKYGVTKLSSATNSTSTSLAATASAVKSAYDLANGRQAKLVSGTNIKTINNTSILGRGNIAIDANIQAVDTQETLDDVNTNTYVKYVAQTLTEEQKAQVRENIGVTNTAGSTSKPIIVVNTDEYTMNFSGTKHMTPNVIYVVTNPLDEMFLEDALLGDDVWYGIQYNSGDVYAEYSVVFTAGEGCSFTFPHYILWSNGTVPEIEAGVAYELSISLTLIGDSAIGRAVLVPFKSV